MSDQKGERPPFHLALPVSDLAATRDFYGAMLGCDEGRSAPTWVDYDFFGHQLSFHAVAGPGSVVAPVNEVDGRKVPVPHFGAVLAPAAWRSLADRLQEAQREFVIEPTVRFRGERGEQSTFFLRDPDGHVLEFKSFADESRLFQR